MVSPTDDAELQRDLGLFAVFTTATGTMIGAGIFILPGPAAAGAGPASALSFGIAGVIALIATMCAVELATAMPRAGGPYYFVSRAMGPLVGTVVGLGSWLALIFKGSFALVGLGQYVRYFSPVPVLAVAVIGGFLLLLINWIGAEESGKLQNGVVIGLIVILGVFAGGGLFAIEGDRLTPFVTTGIDGIIATTGLVFISYLGIVKATAVAEEVKDPGTTLPKGLLAAVCFVTALYILTMLIVTGVLPIDGIIDSNAPVADAGAVYLGALGGGLIALAGIFATVSTGNAAILASSRFPFAMSRDGLVPPALRKTSPRFGTPTRSIWLTGGVMIGLTLVLDVEGLAKLGGTFGILVFALLNVTVVLLRSAKPDWYDPDFRAPLSPVLPLIGSAAALLLIPFMGLLSQASAVLFIILGIAWYALQTQVGESVEPRYGLRDQLDRVEYQRALDEKAGTPRWTAPENGAPRITVEVVEGERDLEFVEILAAFAHRFDATLDVVVIAEVPPQLSLSEFDHEVDDAWLAELQGRLEEKGCAVEYHHVLARDRTAGLLDSVTPETELIVADWDDPIRRHHVRESHVDELLRLDPPTRLVALKDRGAPSFGDSETADSVDASGAAPSLDRIVVATGERPYDRAEVELADAIAVETGATLELVKVIPADASEEVRDRSWEYLADLRTIVEGDAETVLVESDDVRTALVEHADGADLLVLGAPSHPDRIHDVFGQTTDIVAADTDASVMVVKEPASEKSWYRRLRERLSGTTARR